MDPLTVNCLPREQDLARMKSWSRYVIAKELSQYHPNLKRFSGVIKYGNPQKQSVFSLWFWFSKNVSLTSSKATWYQIPWEDVQEVQSQLLLSAQGRPCHSIWDDWSTPESCFSLPCRGSARMAPTFGTNFWTCAEHYGVWRLWLLGDG